MNRIIHAGLMAACAAALLSCATVPSERMSVATSMITIGGDSPKTKWEEIPVTSVETKSSVYMVTYVRWEPADSDAGTHKFRWEWFNGDKLVYRWESSGIPMKNTPFRAWCRSQAAGLGLGHLHVRFYIDGRLMAANEFDIVDINAKP